jgi:hypothetical protein
MQSNRDALKQRRFRIPVLIITLLQSDEIDANLELQHTTFALKKFKLWILQTPRCQMVLHTKYHRCIRFILLNVARVSKIRFADLETNNIKKPRQLEGNNNNKFALAGESHEGYLSKKVCRWYPASPRFSKLL